MGARKWGKKNMVAPSWDMFQGNDEMIDNSQVNEFEQELPGEASDNSKPEGEKPEWGNFSDPETYQGEIDPTEEKNINYFVRNIVSNASRIGEQIGGAPGNIEKLGKSILRGMPQAGGILGWAISELVGPEKWEQIMSQQILPTSEEYKSTSKKLTKGYTSPKTKGEKKFQGYIEDIGATLRGGRANTLRNVAVNNLGIPAASNAVKDIVEGLGFGEEKGTIAKLATWTALSFLGNVNAPQYASNLTNEGRQGIPQNLNINVPRLQQRLQNLANNPQLLHADPRTSLARESIQNINRDLAAGQTSVRSLMTTYDGVNASKRNAGLFQLNRGDRNFARRSIDMVRDAVREEILNAGQNHPAAINSWTSGIQAWATIHQSRAISNWIQNLAGGKYAKIISGPAAALFGISAYSGIKAPLVALPGAIALPGAYKIGQTAYRTWNDPNLSRYYWNAISEAQKENIPAFINNYNKLNKGLESSDKEGKTKK